FVLSSPEDVEAAVVERQPLWTNRKEDHGPFDIIGDVHGCCDELEALLTQLGYQAPSGGVEEWKSGRAEEARKSFGGPELPLFHSAPGPIPKAGGRSSSGTWWTAGRASSIPAGWCAAWSRQARRSVCPATTI